MKTPQVSYHLDEQNRFHIEGYNWARNFSNFFPGIAGKWGIPLWAYYVNRGQALCSMGVGTKNHQILEFHSFNKACLTVGTQSFRTFVRVDGKDVHEPFVKTADARIKQTMIISAGELELVEDNPRLGLRFQVTYFPMAGLPLAAMVRQVTITNLTRRKRQLAWLDGVARILPFGMDQKLIKFVARHIEGMMGVVDVGGVPVFRLKQSAADSEKIDRLEGGNFYMPLAAPGARTHVVVDPDAVFADMAYDVPWVFAQGGMAAVTRTPQLRENKTPCAFTALEQSLPPNGSVQFTSVIGYADTDERLRNLQALTRKKTFLKANRVENMDTLERIQDHIFTVSGSSALDAYCRQDFLDNVMRGGMPLMFQTAQGKRVYYVYSRQNGDLERDYHHFVLQPTYLSQGTGHYRSVLQNRRTDGWFWPETEDANLTIFMNLMQLDGYNPLEVNEHAYRLAKPAQARAWLERRVTAKGARQKLWDMMQQPFAPGAFLMKAESVLGSLKDREGWLAELMALCTETELGGLHEGFWADHWTYTIDLLDTYLMIYPDRLTQLLVGRKDYTFFDDPDVILPRAEKTVDAGGRIRRYGAVQRDKEKAALVASRTVDAFKVRTDQGQGDVFKTTLLVKLLCLVTNRLANLDPSGVGLDMEADKPGWNDSMNGLPGLFGSSLCEALELHRTLGLLRGALAQLGALQVEVYQELAGFMAALKRVVDKRLADRSAGAALAYWDASNTLKETYRRQTRLGISGKTTVVRTRQLDDFLASAAQLLDDALNGSGRSRAISPQGVPHTYFVHDVTAHKATGKKSHQGLPLVTPTRFKQRPVKLFLEGPVHHMKAFPQQAAQVYRAVKRSGIYDRKLKMYKSCEDMTGESFELGRAVGAYPRGWIENESIYLHMEYKYLLEILRSGLCKEFYQDIRTALMPFMDPQVYGRSILEGASFIVSSAYADPKHHGQAFQPRLSGLTCEFLHMWIIMVAGEHPFRLDAQGRLELALQPRLADWLFTQSASTHRYLDGEQWTTLKVPRRAFAFKFINRCLVIYHNARAASTFGPDAAAVGSYRLTYRDGRQVEVKGTSISGAHALAVRDGKVRQMDVTLV